MDYTHRTTVCRMTLLASAMLLTTGIQAQTSDCQFDSKTNSVICGNNTTTSTAANTVVIGANASVELENSVSIGTNSTATEIHTTEKGGTYGYGNKNVAGVDDVTGVVSVGNPDETRQVQNVSAGVITEDSTDAVNASQLYYTNKAIANNASKISSVNGDISYNTKLIRKNTTNITTNKKQIDENTKNISNLSGDIKKGLNIGGEEGQPINYQLGDTVHIFGGDNITTTSTADSLLVTLNPNVNVQSLTTGNTVMNNNGITIVDSNVSLTNAGLNNGGNVITNVAPGVADTDAVNVSQLNALDRKLSNQIQEVEDIANAGTAAAIAASQIPQPYTAGASMIGFGASTYSGQSAFSLGISTISDNGQWIIKGTATYDTQQKAGVGVGIGYQW